MDIKQKLKGLNYYLLESNYEEQALLTNPKYPFNIKKRINSDLGHLSNKQANQYLKELTTENTKMIFFGHLSDKNNDYDLVQIINENISNIEKYILFKDKVFEKICK